MCPLGAVVTMTGAYVLFFTAILLIKSGADWHSGKFFGCAERFLVLFSVMSLFNVALSMSHFHRSWCYDQKLIVSVSRKKKVNIILQG